MEKQKKELMFETIERLTHKGVIVVWLALFLLFLLLALAGMAVDGSYLYFAKNQLQVAADSAVLAGVGAGLSGSDNSTSALAQTDARRAAWKFACKNTADQFNPDPGGLNNHVYLVSDFGLRSVTESNFMDTTCDNAASSLTATQLNGTSNDPNGDIVVGYWTLPPAPGGVTCERVGAGFFCPATGSTNLPINAVKAVARRTGDAAVPNVKFGGNHVRLFLGQIMRLIGANWSFMNVTASAIAGPNQLQIGAFPICLPSCQLNTPLNGQWSYDKNEPAPILCTDEDGSPPGQLFVFESSSQADVIKKPGLAWTAFSIASCPSTHCDIPTPNDVRPFILGTQQPPDICNKYICTTNGTMSNLFDDLQTQFDKNKKPYTFTVGGTTVTVNGWEILVPVVSNLSCGAPQSTCPGAQGGPPAANPYLVSQLAHVLITEVVKPQGIRFVAFNNARNYSTTVVCKHETKTINRIITSLGDISGNCPGCSEPQPSGSGGSAKLVK